MPYLTLGTSSQLQIQVPTPGTTDWADTLKTQTFLKIAEHDHTGAGKGSQLGTGSILANAINGTKIRLANNEYLRGRNQAGSADINLLKVNASDKGEFGVDIAVLALVNNAFLKGRNAADSAYINLLKVNASDKIELGATVVSATVETINSSLLKKTSSVTLTDNTTIATDATVVTLLSGETRKVLYKLIRNSVIQKGELELIYPNTCIETYEGTDNGVTFSLDTGVLKYTSTSTGNNITMSYVIIEE